MKMDDVFNFNMFMLECISNGIKDYYVGLKGMATIDIKVMPDGDFIYIINVINDKKFETTIKIIPIAKILHTKYMADINHLYDFFVRYVDMINDKPKSELGKEITYARDMISTIIKNLDKYKSILIRDFEPESEYMLYRLSLPNEDFKDRHLSLAIEYALKKIYPDINNKNLIKQIRTVKLMMLEFNMIHDQLPKDNNFDIVNNTHVGLLN